jgi:cysteine synthase A
VSNKKSKYDRVTMPARSVLDVIGATPLVELSRITTGLGGRILAKLEYLNPGHSKKDRIALQMIEEAEADGSLVPGQTVVELTSGNTGTGLALVCAVKGYPYVAVMSRGNSSERARMMSALGAEVILVDQALEGTDGRVSGDDVALIEEKTQEVVNQRKAFRPDQFKKPGNPNAHYYHTAREIMEQSGGIDVFCDFVGSGGTFGGCSRYFKEVDSNIQCYVVEPESAAVMAGKEVTDPNHRIQGGGYSMPDLLYIDRSMIDGFLRVTDDQAMTTARRLAREEGIFAGFSSGANAAAALDLLSGPCAGKTIAILMCDSGMKYLSTDLWEEMSG